MASPKKRRAATGDDPSRGKKGKPIGYRPSSEVTAALDDFRGKFEFPPDQSAVIERALLMYLGAKGYKFTSHPDSDS